MLYGMIYLMIPSHDTPRHAASPSDKAPDIARYTMPVAEAVVAFRDEGLSVTDRTIQRYCHSGKLRAIRVDPDTRQPTDKDAYVFLIDPSSIPERISQIREKQEFARTTVVATDRDESRNDAAGRDRSGQDAAASEQPGGANDGEVEALRNEVQSLKIDKAVRDQMIEQMKEDRASLLGQLESHVQTMVEQGKTIGQLETRLQILAPDAVRDGRSPKEPGAVDDGEAPSVENRSDEHFRI